MEMIFAAGTAKLAEVEDIICLQLQAYRLLCFLSRKKILKRLLNRFDIQTLFADTSQYCSIERALPSVIVIKNEVAFTSSI